ncbi:MAG: helix-turn-helix domain-containing protein, partial [Myxococcota bacterium]
SRIARVDVRIVACTHRNLTEEVKAGRFRADLYYRLAVVEFTVPPLRQRPEDIPALLELFRRRYAERFGVEDVHFSPRLGAEFQQRPWPGNVRELENTVARLIALSPGGEIDRAPDVGAHTYGSETMAPATYRALMNGFERHILEQALARCDGNRSAAARQLDMSRTTLMDKLKRHGLIA